VTTSRHHPAVYRGIRVLDCTQGIAGPTATMHLADLGADVLKVEPLEGDRSAAERGYQCWNRNKQLIVLDLRTKQTCASCGGWPARLM
jgi:crotonobetainyl-CoA:carnitine CoA-transferase CaiB-like acyl-CoA transferase